MSEPRMPGAWISRPPSTVPEIEIPNPTTARQIDIPQSIPIPPPASRTLGIPYPTTQQTSASGLPYGYNTYGFPASTIPQYPTPREADVPNQDPGTEERNKKPIVIAVFGQTGTGKTSFIRAVTGQDLQVGHSLTSCEISNRFNIPKRTNLEADRCT